VLDRLLARIRRDDSCWLATGAMLASHHGTLDPATILQASSKPV
jgi:hypothetical protein